ncbi:hypothetical protein Pcinc_003280 [Petrolisthes cinctipes]|uniref:Transcription factor IIIC 90kDa subunit N-terminal domain-containing protein n=1 Tax=Petrolisthes cinctipes TaxID=88211 RepID=A0AAE1GJN1_PETCI|nr:hypothetical protein Pcinc_003280 [Petrolisthes cinctipes]
MFTRYFIPIPNELSPAINPGIEMSEVLTSLEQSGNQSVMLDSVVSSAQRARVEQDPRNPCTTLSGMPGGEPIHRGYSKGAWSPPGVGENGMCVLSLSTRHHKLTIWSKVGRHWVSLACLSDVWFEYNATRDWTTAATTTTNPPAHLVYEARCRLLAVSQLVWTPVYRDKRGQFSSLVTLMGNGCVVFWRVECNFKCVQQASVLNVCEANMTGVSAVHWCHTDDRKGYLTVGSNEGSVRIFVCHFTDKGVNFKSVCDVWDKCDRLCVRDVHLTHIPGSKQHLAIFSKHNLLMATSLRLTNHHNKSPSVIHTSHIFIADLEISGIIVFEDMSVYVSAKDGVVKHVFINVSGEDGKTTIEEGDTVFQSEDVMYCGLATSPNNILFAVFETIRVAYDHLVEREPTLVNVYRLGDIHTLIQGLLKSPAANLHSKADVFESIRINMCKAGHCPVDLIRANQIPKQSVATLKVHYWLVKICRSSCITDHQLQETIKELEPLLQKAIMGRWMTDVLKQQCSGDLPKMPSLLLSLSLMTEWLKNTHKLTNTFESLVKKLGSNKKELCPVCKEKVPLTSLTHGQCRNGHTLPRCCRSLLVTEPNIICPRCRVYAHSDSHIVMKEKVFRCTYCDGFMVHQIRPRQ